MTKAKGKRNPQGFAVVTVVLMGQIGLFAVAIKAIIQGVSPKSAIERESCMGSVQRADKRFPKGPRLAPGQNRTEHVLERIWSTRADLKIFTDASGKPDIAALLRWSNDVPDSSAIFVAGCINDARALARQAGFSLGGTGLELLSGSLKWMDRNTTVAMDDATFDRNRNSVFELTQLGREAFVSEFVEKNARAPSAKELMNWVFALPVDNPNLDRAWASLTRMQIETVNR